MEVKTFPYAVIWGGEIVPPNTPIKVKEATISEKENVATEKPKKGAKKNDKRGIDKA